MVRSVKEKINFLFSLAANYDKYICLILIAAIAFNFLFLPAAALAQSKPDSDVSFVGQIITWFTAKPLLFASSLISMILSGLFGLIISLEAQIIDYILSPSNFPITTAPIVTLGWGITRDLANMFFILILLIISFTTVLRIKSWAIQQLWWKIIVAALLINFSLVIAGFVIDFTNILTQFFLKQITGGGIGTVTTKLAAGMQILNFYNPAPPTSVLGGIGQFGPAGIAAVIGVILTVIGLVITAFVFGAAMIFLVVRILYLWLLLIFAPIVWMLWILPDTSKYFSQWWDKFIQWAFFAPIYTFMIYLSLSIFDATGKLSPKFFGVLPNAWGTPAPGISTVGMPAAIFQWILVIAMMFGSLIVAQKFGVSGAAASQKMLVGWGTNTKNWAGRELRKRALGVGAKEAAPGVSARPGLLVRGAQRLAAVPGGRLLAGQVFKMTAAEAGTIEDAQKQFTNWTPEAIQAYLKQAPGRIASPFVQNQQIGAALALKEKGQLEKLSEPRIRELVALASRYSPKDVDKLLEVAPHMAIEFNKSIKVILGKVEKANQIMLSSLSYQNPQGSFEVALNLNPEQLRTIAQKADDAKIQEVKRVVEAEFSGLAAPIQAEINRILTLTNRDRRNRELNTFLNNQAATGTPRDEVQRLEKIARTRATTQSPAWQI